MNFHKTTNRFSFKYWWEFVILSNKISTLDFYITIKVNVKLEMLWKCQLLSWMICFAIFFFQVLVKFTDKHWYRLIISFLFLLLLSRESASKAFYYNVFILFIIRKRWKRNPFCFHFWFYTRKNIIKLSHCSTENVSLTNLHDSFEN